MRLLTALAIGLFLQGLAFAQQPPAPADAAPGANPVVPQASPPQSGSGVPQQGTSIPPPPPGASQPEAGAERFLTIQSKNEWLVGNVWNRSVYNASGQAIGNLNDVLVDPNGKITAILIGVGGFLGLGEKNVAVDFAYLKNNGAISGDRIVISMTEQELRSAPNFQRLKVIPNTSNK